ncbi:hypothetical protein EV182_002442, partial [Spiromyces aspiralis]
MARQIKLLPEETRQKLGVGPVVTSVDDVVRELVENSIDANATFIQVVLTDNGLSKIMVTDDGTGLRESDIVMLGQRGCTSKITSYSDLTRASSLGFRGEALHSICICASSVSISSKTAADSLGTSITLDSKNRTAISCGTRVVVAEPLSAFPVRRE